MPLRLFFRCLLLILPLGVLAKPPNVLLIISDDQAWSDYGFMGHEHIKTPHIDRLAAESLTYSRGYTPIALCRPALSTMATGLYPHEHGVTGNDPSLPEPKIRNGREKSHLAPIYDAIIGNFARQPNFIRDLTDRGYLSLQTGKWWEGNPRETGGFTHAMTQGDPGRHGDVGLKISREGHQPIEDFWADADKADKPWLIWHAPFLPHTPHNPPEDLLAEYMKVAPNEAVARYWANVEWFDRTVGELLAALEARGERENTIILYTCDNGWIASYERHRFAPRSKTSPYEGGTRTPIMVSWPGHIEPRMDERNLATNIDIWPTIAGLLGTEVPEALDGINLTDANAVANRDSIYGEQFDHDISNVFRPAESLQARWVIRNQWKLIAHQPLVEPADPLQLYDLQADPEERKNLAKAHPQITAELLAALDDWWTPYFPNPRGDRSLPLK